MLKTSGKSLLGSADHKFSFLMLLVVLCRSSFPFVWLWHIISWNFLIFFLTWQWIWTFWPLSFPFLLTSVSPNVFILSSFILSYSDFESTSLSFIVSSALSLDASDGFSRFIALWPMYNSGIPVSLRTRLLRSESCKYNKQVSLFIKPIWTKDISKHVPVGREAIYLFLCLLLNRLLSHEELFDVITCCLHHDTLFYAMSDDCLMSSRILLWRNLWCHNILSTKFFNRRRKTILIFNIA